MSNLKRFRGSFAIVFGLMLAALMLWGQVETGQIVGTVQDASGAVVPNVTITAKNVATGTMRTSATNAAGVYVIPNLTAGDWEITFSASGFATKKERVTVEVGAQVGLDAKMEVGQTSTTVEVSAGAVRVNTESQTLSNTISTQQVTELPSLTRNPYDFVATVPNVTSDMQSGRGVGYAINGMRSSSTDVMLDGVANNDDFTAQTGQQVPLDSVQEYQVVTSDFSAEYGRASGGVVNVMTKSGTNDFHGTAYEFNRASALASNSFFNNANELPKPIYTRNNFGYSIGGPIIKNKLFFFQNTEWTRVRSYANEVAVVPTSQLIAAAAPATQAFFSAYGTLRSDLSTIATFTKASLPSICNGGSATGGCASLSASTPMFNEVTYQTPNDSGGGAPQNTYDIVGNVDFNLSEKTQMSFKYALYNEDDFAGFVNTSPYKGYETGQTNVDNHATFSLTHTFSPSLVSQTRLSFNRLNNLQPLGTAPVGPTLYMNSSSAPRVNGQLIAFPGYNEYTPGSAIPFGGPQNFGVLSEDVTKVRGRHNIRFGGMVNYEQDNRTFGAYEEAVESLGSNTGNSLDNFLNGQLHQFQAAVNPQGNYPGGTINLPVGPPNFSRSNRYNEFALYGQDNFKVTSRLSINYGMRWEYFGVQHNKNDALDSNIVFSGPFSLSNLAQLISTATVKPTPSNPNGGLWQKDYKDFSPRVGFAYALTADGKTSLRGGYGIGYERNFGNVTFNVIQNPPAYAVIALTAGSDLPQIPVSVSNAGPLAGNTGSKVLPGVSLRGVDPNIKNSYAHTMSLTLERQVTNNVLASLGYSGSHGERLYDISHDNDNGYGPEYLGTPCTPGTYGNIGTCGARLNSQYTGINLRGGNGTSGYNSMIAQMTFKDVAHSGVTLQANYTWSHAMDDLSSAFTDGQQGNFQLGYMDPFHPGLDYGNSDFDAKQRVSISAVWAIPVLKGHSLTDRILGGWELAPIFTANTGNPFTMYDCTNAYSYCPRAQQVSATPPGGVTNVPAPGTPDDFQYYQFTNFATGALSYYNPKLGISDDGPWPANMIGRNTFRAPGNWNLNLGLYKNTKVTERVGLQLRLELYNAVNHANFFIYGADTEVENPFADGYFNGNRNLQLGAKIVF
ncbi:MAG TPA: TonB-dependent receptor [Bryobacteraceae bacterium]|nr:TonB-dependent receptor [Bryobacteraceae bacterium]